MLPFNIILNSLPTIEQTSARLFLCRNKNREGACSGSLSVESLNKTSLISAVA